MAWVSVPVQSTCGPTADHESYLGGFVAKITALLKDDAVNRVALWGLEGSGKTVIASTLHTNIEDPTCALQFDLVIWVECCKKFDFRRQLHQIARRLTLFYAEDAPDAVIAGLIFRKLLKFKTCLFILDDAQSSIDLDRFGIPWRNYQGDNGVRVKILITTRDRGVCRKLLVDQTLKLDFLSVDDAWKYFCSLVGDNATSATIAPIAKQLCNKLQGYPFAITAVGNLIGRSNLPAVWWKFDLQDLKEADRAVKFTRKIIYASLKLTYDSLQDKKMKPCFLLCASYPMSCVIKVKEIVCLMVSKGIIEDCEGCQNDGLVLVQGLKDVFLLEDGLDDETVAMHAVIHDFARWLMSTNEGNMHGCILQNIEQEVQLHDQSSSPMTN
ncbi:PREDICTED: probable disease resistance protein At4g27220 [Camelina sativa]|uniref:Probable disease resistance protein At4g27220 n=1 Tax=Camelina sativa TaxID=90675 RepID=A0ABM0URF9_CAMSA|nr:PREDICTED: probable disease resistance protein At4g27220 [Camelina sativa]